MDQDDLLQPERLETLQRIATSTGSTFRRTTASASASRGIPAPRFPLGRFGAHRHRDEILDRKEDDFLRFRAVMDGSGSLSSSRTGPSIRDGLGAPTPMRWSSSRSGCAISEDSPLYSSSSSHQASKEELARLETRVETLAEKLASLTKDMSERIASIEESNNLGNYRGDGGVDSEEIHEMRDSERAFRETMASTIRALAGTPSGWRVESRSSLRTSTWISTTLLWRIGPRRPPSEAAALPPLLGERRPLPPLCHHPGGEVEL